MHIKAQFYQNSIENLLGNHFAISMQILLELFLDGPLSMLCPAALYTQTWQSLLKIVIPTLLNITRLSDLLFFRKVPSDQTFLEPEF